MPFPLLIPLILAGASAAGGYLANRRSPQTQTSVNSIDPAYAGLQNIINPMIEKRLSTPLDTGGLRATNLTSINKDYGEAQMGLNNALSARGLSTSPIAGAADANLNTKRVGAIAEMDQKMPLLQEEYQRQNLLDALNMINSTRSNTTTIMGGGQSGAAGAVSGVASMLGFLYGQGAFGKTPTAGMPNPGYTNLNLPSVTGGRPSPYFPALTRQ